MWLYVVMLITVFLHQHSGSRAGVVGVVRSHEVSPLLGRLGALSIGALIVPSRGVLSSGGAGNSEASIGYT